MADEDRWEYLAKNIESLHEAAFENTKNIATLTERMSLHEERWERLRRALAAALLASLDQDGEGETGSAQ